MKQAEEELIQRVRDLLFNEYMMSTHTSSKRCQSLLLRTYKDLCEKHAHLGVLERKEEYDKARCAEKKATAKKCTG